MTSAPASTEAASGIGDINRVIGRFGVNTLMLGARVNHNLFDENLNKKKRGTFFNIVKLGGTLSDKRLEYTFCYDLCFCYGKHWLIWTTSKDWNCPTV